MRALLIVLLMALPCWAQTTVYTDAVVDDEAGVYYYFPDVLNGAVLWIDPDDASTVTESGGDATAVADKVGGLSFTSTTSNDPAYTTAALTDGRSVGILDFDRANSEALEVAATPLGSTLAATCSVFAVAVSDDTTNAQAVWSINDDLAFSDLFETNFRGDAADSIQTAVIESASDSYSSSAGTLAYSSGVAYTLATVRASSTNTRLWVDGAGMSTASTDLDPAGLASVRLGKRVTTNLYLDGQVRAVVVHGFALTTSTVPNRSAVEEWLWRDKINADSALGGTK